MSGNPLCMGGKELSLEDYPTITKNLFYYHKDPEIHEWLQEKKAKDEKLEAEYVRYVGKSTNLYWFIRYIQTDWIIRG